MEQEPIIEDNNPPTTEEKADLDADIRRAERLLKRAERDMLICNLFLSGSSMKEIATLANLSRQQVHHIIRRYDVKRPETHRLTREELVGVVINEDDKRALRIAADKQGISMSQWTLNLIKEKLAEIKNRERLAALKGEQ